MVKYLQVIIDILNKRIAGMKANLENWSHQIISIQEVETIIFQLEAQSVRVKAAAATLKKERKAARTMIKAFTSKQKQVDNIIISIHMPEPEKFSEYGLAPRKTPTPRGIPARTKIKSIVNNSEGRGFKITWQRVADVHHYEIERSVTDNTSEISLAPPYEFYATSTKISFTDEDIEKGHRYFYRVRGVNARGTGEWSEPVNKVQ